MSAAVARGHNPDPTSTKRRWRTPPTLYAVLDREFWFTLDAAAEDGASLASRWITPQMDCLVTPWAPLCAPNAHGGRNAFANFPWGPQYSQCPAPCPKAAKHPPGSDKPHRCHSDSFPGTGAFVTRALDQVGTLDYVVLLLPTAPDTSWWRAAFRAAHQVRLLPRVSFLDGDTLRPMTAPPGAGVTIFVLGRTPAKSQRVLLADELGDYGG